MTHTVDSIKSLLETSNAAVERALQVLYDFQTADEKASEQTSHNNGAGFNAVDAEILSSFACQVNAKVGAFSDYLGRPRKLGETLSPKQMAIARKKVARYAKQLAEAANAKAPKVEEAPEVVEAPKAKEAYPIVKPEPKTLREKLAILEEEYQAESLRPITYYDGRPMVNILYFQVQELKREIMREEKEAKAVAKIASELALSGKAKEAGELIEGFVSGLELEREMWEMEARGDREGTRRDEASKAKARAEMEKAPKSKPDEFRLIRDHIMDWTRK